MDVISAQYTLHNVNTHLMACLGNYLTNSFTHGTLQHIMAIFCDPYDVEPVVDAYERILNSA